MIENTSMVYEDSFPLIAMLNLPLLAPVSQEDSKAWQAEYFTHSLVEQELTAMNAKFLWTVTTMGYDMIGNKRVTSVADMDGARISGSITGFAGKLVQAAGATAVPLSTPDTYAALQTNVVDLAMVSDTSTIAYGYQDISKYVMRIGIPMSRGLLVMCNIDSWNALPEDIQKEIMDIIPEVEQYAIDYQTNLDDEAGVTIEAAVDEVIIWSDAEVAKLEALAASLWGEYVQKLNDKGLPGQEILDFAISARP
jgi:TRAP-type C4-dicarboxylate transport system substrate-binding protein